MRKNLILLIVLLFMSSGAAIAATAEVGMVTQLNGNVTYQASADKVKSPAARNFMKLYENDTITLASDAVIQIVYLGSGRKETWKGPANFEVGKTQGVPRNASDPGPKVSTMNSGVTGEVMRLAMVVDPSRLQKTGSSSVRGEKSEPPPPVKPPVLSESDKKLISAAKKTYQDLFKDAESSDITPELYFFSVLADYDQFEDMKSLIAGMRKKQPENKDIDLLEEWMNRQR